MAFETYYQRVGTTPSPLAKQVVGLSKGGALALDLGAGNLRHSHYFLANGFETVVAVERNPQKTPLIHRIDYHQMEIEAYVPPRNYFDLALCHSTFFFIKKEDVYATIKRVHVGLRTGALFAFDVAGVNDSWAKEEDGFAKVTSFSSGEIAALTDGFDVVSVKEKEFEDTRPSRKVEHRHLWDLILRK